MLSGQAGRDVTMMPHQVLIEEYGNLTMLEMFLALAPGQVPDARLEAYHAVEAQLWGRDDDSIRAAPYDPEALIEKVTEQHYADCEAIANNFVQGNTTSSAFYLDSNNAECTTPFVTTAHSLAICNNEPSIWINGSNSGVYPLSAYTYWLDGNESPPWNQAYTWYLYIDGWAVIYTGPVAVGRSFWLMFNNNGNGAVGATAAATP